MTSMNGAPTSFPTRWWTALPDGRVRCDVCPRECALHDGQRGLCFVRRREHDAIVLTTYGRSSGFCIDPIEKKPLHHFLPGSSVLSFGTAGCNLACRFCQNWDISKSRSTDTLADAASPRTIAEAALAEGCASVAFTYNDPIVFLEYAADVADECHAVGLRTVAVSSGYVHPGPREELFGRMDAVNIDLKSFDDDFYRHVCGGRLQPVLDTLVWLVANGIWVEVTTLVIPGHNDSDAELGALSAWLVDQLGPRRATASDGVPPRLPDARCARHTAGHPDPSPRPGDGGRSAVRLHRQRARRGRRHHHVPRVRDPGGGTRLVPARVVPADGGWSVVERAADRCPECSSGPPGEWGRRRRPVRLAEREGGQ